MGSVTSRATLALTRHGTPGEGPREAPVVLGGRARVRGAAAAAVTPAGRRTPPRGDDLGRAGRAVRAVPRAGVALRRARAGVLALGRGGPRALALALVGGGDTAAAAGCSSSSAMALDGGAGFRGAGRALLRARRSVLASAAARRGARPRARAGIAGPSACVGAAPERASELARRWRRRARTRRRVRIARARRAGRASRAGEEAGGLGGAGRFGGAGRLGGAGGSSRERARSPGSPRRPARRRASPRPCRPKTPPAASRSAARSAPPAPGSSNAEGTASTGASAIARGDRGRFATEIRVRRARGCAARARETAHPRRDQETV